MIYLVTGGSGFIGSHLIENLLKKGHSVINVDNFDDFYDYKIKIGNTLESLNINQQFEFADKKKDIERLSALTKFPQYQLFFQDIRDKSGLEKIFSENTIDMVIQFHVKKIVCASSSSVYGNNQKVPFSENDNVDNPISPYAATKKCVEILGHVYHDLYKIDMIQLRFFTVYGPRHRPDLAICKFTKLISEDKEIPFYGDGNTARDYTYIDDIIDGILKSASYLENNSGVYEIINLGENEVITLSEMLSEIEKNLGKTAIRKNLPLQPGDVLKTNADIAKARRLIDYHPATNFQNGIKKFVEWFLRK